MKIRISRITDPPLLVVILLIAASTGAVGQSASNSDPLKRYTTCKLSGDLKVKEVARRPKGNKYRYVKTDNGDEKVSVLDGYRVMFGYGDVRYYFANVKIEQSDAASYLEDKERIINELKYLSASKQATGIIFSDRTMLNGFEHYGIDRDKLDVGATVGTHVLFYDEGHLVVTVYLLNQDDKGLLRFPSGERRFTNIEEYTRLKDQFLGNYSECLKEKATANP